MGVTSRKVRIGYSAVLATILTSGICGDVIAKTGKGRLHARGSASNARAEFPANGGLLSQQQAGLGPVRYYGGPKSPTWRGPAE